MWAATRPVGRLPRTSIAGALVALLAAALLASAPGAAAAPAAASTAAPASAPTSPPGSATSAPGPTTSTTAPPTTSASTTTAGGPPSATTTRAAPTRTRAPASSPAGDRAPGPDASPPPREDRGGDVEPPPAPPPAFTEAIAGALPGQDALVAEAMALTQSVAATTAELDKLGLEAEAAGDVYRQAETELGTADERAARARSAAEAADAQLQNARDELGRFARNSYIGGTQISSDLLLLDATSPADLVARAGLLESVADSQTDALDRVMRSQARSETAGELAEQAVSTKAEAESRAGTALEESTARLAQQEERLGDLQQQKTDLDAQLYTALVELLGPEGAAVAFAQYEADLYSTDAEAALARRTANGGGPVLSGAWALPLAGRLSTCFCLRWGTMHWGIDIAAPMYTPMYAAGNGTVIRAGEATGFGLAVYIQHDNGDVTVYGHMEVIEVSTGQRVAAGQEIALVGSRGFSTGPHLHLEVLVGGLDGPRVDPVTWLADRGIFI